MLLLGVGGCAGGCGGGGSGRSGGAGWLRWGRLRRPGWIHYPVPVAPIEAQLAKECEEDYDAKAADASELQPFRVALGVRNDTYPHTGMTLSPPNVGISSSQASNGRVVMSLVTPVGSAIASLSMRIASILPGMALGKRGVTLQVLLLA